MKKLKNSFFTFIALTIPAAGVGSVSDRQHPNVIIIITDDQGYGDLGFTGNPHVQTPVLDQFDRESVRFNLMTGRYSLRTGVRDTYHGGAVMATEEVTIAEMLKDAGYHTGILKRLQLISIFFQRWRSYAM